MLESVYYNKKLSNYTKTNYIRKVYLKSAPSVRYYSTNVINVNKNITSETLNQGVTITDEELDELKNIPGVKFDL